MVAGIIQKMEYSNLELLVKERIESIANCLYNSYDDVDESDLLGGKAGVALFMLHYHTLFPQEDLRSRAIDWLQASIEEQSKHLSTTLSTGWTGVNYVVEQFKKCGWVDKNVSNFLRDIDEVISRSMLEEIKYGSYDLLHGAIGKGLYLLGKGNKYKPAIREFVSHLNNNSVVEGDTIKWHFYTQGKLHRGVYNLGLSHGIPSILGFLTRVYTSNTEKQTSKKLILGTIQFLKENKLDFLTNKCYYRSSINSNQDTAPAEAPSRLGWCYGDLGVAIPLLSASEALNLPDVRELALEIFLTATTRKDLKVNNVVDASFCHGTAGLAHIYDILHRKTGLPQFKETQHYWLNETLKMSKFEDGLVGYKHWAPSRGGWEKNYGLLEGIAGIGLIFLSSISPSMLDWDECFLLNN